MAKFNGQNPDFLALCRILHRDSHEWYAMRPMSVKPQVAKSNGQTPDFLGLCRMLHRESHEWYAMLPMHVKPHDLRA